MESRPHSPFGNRARREAPGQTPPAASAVEAPELAPQPEDPEKERRRLEALADLERLKADEARRTRQRMITGVVVTLVLLVGVVIVVKFVQRTFRTAQFNNARSAFLSAVKRSNSANPREGRLGIFGGAKQLLDRYVQNDTGNPEGYLHAAVVDLYLYEGARNQDGDKADPASLTEARRYLDEAFKLKPDYPEAHYYAAVVSSFHGERRDAITSLERCADNLDRVYGAGSVESSEWKERAEAARKKIESAPEGETPPLDVRPVRCMLTGIETAK